jgi:hypothetical protein
MAIPSWRSRHGDPFCDLTSRSRRCAMAVLSHPALRDLQFWRDACITPSSERQERLLLYFDFTARMREKSDSTHAVVGRTDANMP